MNNTRYTKKELNGNATGLCDILYNRMINHRIAKCDYGSTKTNAWDLTLVAVSCSSKKSPYECVRAHNCTTLKQCHPTLAAALPCPLGQKPPKDKEAKLGIPSIVGNSYEAGHCAEPHAANRLLNKMPNNINLQITEIDFSDAFMVKNKIPIAYCRTCKLTFPQLR